MNINEAIKSGKKFKRGEDAWATSVFEASGLFLLYENGIRRMLTLEDLTAEDWVVYRDPINVWAILRDDGRPPIGYFMTKELAQYWILSPEDEIINLVEKR